MSDRAERPLHFVVPDTIDDDARVSGGNVYDQHIRDDLIARGRAVTMVPIADGREWQAAQALALLADGALALVDGLIVARAPGVLADHSERLRLVVLAHTADFEGEALRAAERVIATSFWTRAQLIERDLAEPHRIVVAQPGADPASATRPSASGGRLLCVAAVAPHKGQDLLIRALAGLPDDEVWSCRIVGSLSVAPDFVPALTAVVESAGLSRRVTFTGVLTGQSLAAEYARADLLIVPSRSESYGMVVSEAFARGIPVLATGAGGLPEAVGQGGAGIVVPPEDPWAITVVLRQWLESPARRDALKVEAMRARAGVRPWSSTGAIIAATLDDLVQTGSARSTAPIGQQGMGDA